MNHINRVMAVLIALAALSIGKCEKTPLYPADSGAIALPDTRSLQGSMLRRDTIAGPIHASVTAIIDGDTFEERARIWFGLEKTILVRVRGIDAPELHARCAAEARGADNAKLALADYLANTQVVLRDINVDKYGGRIVANVLIADPTDWSAPLEDIDDLMLAAHLARPYGGGARQTWCSGPVAVR